MPTAESEVKSLAAILMGISVSDLVDVTPDNQSFVRRLYKDKGGKGFAAYTVTAGGYQGSIDTQTVIWIDNDCTVKGIKKIAFITSPANDNPPYTPPTQAEIDALFDRLVGKNINSLGSVDAITNATRTTNTLKGAITEALEAVSAIAPVNYTARVIGIVAASLAVLGFAAYIAVPKIIRRRKEQA